MSKYKNVDEDLGYTDCEMELSRLQPGKFQPRKHFDEAALNELAQSIKVSGVLQHIIARPIDDDHYEIVAGERRYRASILAGLTTIPVRVRVMSDSEALLIATEENIKRMDMNIIEESYAANMAVSLCEGDRKAAMSLLGWSDKKLTSRLMLLNLSSNAQSALLQSRIHIGHAELICTLTEDNQNKAVASIIEKNITVAELKLKLQEFAYVLSTAIFDTQGCNGCVNNTSNQYELFSESIGTGHCTNSECWSNKENNKIDQIRCDKQSEYNVVYLDVERLPNSYNYLIEKDVGKSQYNQCIQCKNFGALISTKGESISRVEDDVCFNTGCYDQKITQQQQAHLPSRQQTTSLKSATPKPTKVGTTRTTANEVPKKLLEYRHQLYRKVLFNELQGNTHLTQVMALVALAQHTNLKDDALLAVFNQKAAQIGIGADVMALLKDSRRNHIHSLYALSTTTIHQLIVLLTAFNAALGEDYFDKSKQDRTVEAQLQIMQPVLDKHFVMTADYLALHSKKGMIGVLRESGFADWYDKKYAESKTQSFARLSNGSIKDMLAKISASGFDFRGYIPTTLALSNVADHSLELLDEQEESDDEATQNVVPTVRQASNPMVGATG